MVPKTHRDELKRKVEYSIDMLERYCVHILDLRSEYDPNYPQQVELLDGLLAFAHMLIRFTRSFRAKV